MSTTPTSPTQPFPPIPVRAPAAPSGSAQPAATGPSRSSNQAGQRIDDGETAKVMIVDDEPINIKVVGKYLRDVGYQNFLTTTDSTQAIELIRRDRPDVILTDVVMPEVSGLDLLQQISADDALRNIPVIVFTASADRETKVKALDLGATDFLAKPVDSSELVARVRNAVLVKAHHDYLENQAEELERLVRLRTLEVAASRREVIYCLALAGEYRDQDTGNHIIRVGRYAGIIARELGFDDKRIEELEQAALLHDVGKIGISDLILLKPGKLTPEEHDEIKKHCEFGSKIVQPASDERWGNLTAEALRGWSGGHSPILDMAAQIAYSHHEHWDGSGYPRGLAGEDIPLEARITSVADVFDALSSARPYKQAFPQEKCFAILQEQRGGKFDPRVLDAFFTRRAEILATQAEFADTAPSS